MDAGNWIALGAFALAFVSALLTLLWYVVGRVELERQWREEADRELNSKFMAFQLEAVRTFAPASAIEKSEERLATSLDKVTARLEMVISRIETLGTELARIAAHKA